METCSLNHVEEKSKWLKQMGILLMTLVMTDTKSIFNAGAYQIEYQINLYKCESSVVYLTSTSLSTLVLQDKR